jgi:hypothetical protein
MHTNTFQHNSRCPRANATEEYRILTCNRCVEIIHRHLCLMNSVCKGVVTESRIKSATIGLLYMIRQGIVVHELVVLPKIPVSFGMCCVGVFWMEV